MNRFPQFDLNGKVALVTGAARGLGRAISLALANAGADVALGLRDRNTGSELTREIESMGRPALPLQMDMAHLDRISSAIEEAVAHFGRLIFWSTTREWRRAIRPKTLLKKTLITPWP
jgi:NAD(P)-dependent dehydrogenase (short-subunit alcohol dehydrogenase family)